MLLKSLELQGFKTFPEKTKFLFGKGITVVVGPNGSGKSNISDAIRWALGEQSVKALRCIKMEDIIFNGTINKKPKGFAESTLTIDNSDRRLPFDEDDIAVSRRYYRSGESEYLINGEIVRLKDISELFMDTGLGRDGYSVISQGKIDSIVSLKSNERREIFEEASGISKYRYRKSEAESKLLKAEDNLLRLNDILKELKDRIGPLHEQSQKAKEYIMLVDKLKSLQIGIWLSILEGYDNKLKDQENKFLIVNNQYNELEDEIQSIVNDAEKILLEVKNNTLDIDEKKNSISKFEEKSLLKKSEISILRNDILHNNENIDRLNNDIQKINDSFYNIDDKINSKKTYVDKLKIDYNNLFKEIEDYKNLLENLQINITDFSSATDKETLNYNSINNKISSEKLKLMTSDVALNDLNLRITESLKCIENSSIEIEKVSDEYLKAKNEYDLINKEFLRISNSLKVNEKNLAESKKSYDFFKSKVDGLTLDYEEKVRKIRFLEELERNLEGFSQSVKFIVKEGKRGTISGICGPVSSIIDVSKDYVIAVETALGAAAQNIVVDSEKNAKKAIDFLKFKNVGRATFLPISTINGKELNESDLLKESGVINLASNLCSCNERYSGILKYLLGRVLVVDTLENAVSISKKFFYKFKVVTLDGQVINTGGSLTGGSRVKNLGFLDRNNNIKEIKIEIDQLKEKLTVLKEALKNKFNNQENFKNLLVSNRSILEELNDKKFRLDSFIKNNEFKLSSLNSMVSSQSLSKEDLLSKIDDVKNKKNTYIKNLESFNLELKKSDENLNCLKLKISSLNSKKDEFNKNIYEKNLALLSLKKDIETNNNYLKEIQTQKISEENKLDFINKEINSLKLKNTQIEHKIECITDEILKLKELTNEYYSQIDKLTTNRMENEKKSTELRNLERNKNIEKEKISLEVSRIRDQKDNFQKDYDDIISKLWNEYEITRREALSSFSKVENNSNSIKLLNEVKLKIKSLGLVNVSAIEEYKEVFERYEFLKLQVNDIENSKKELYKLINDLTSQMKNLFSERFTKINYNFNEVFKDLFGGGKAELKLSEPNDVLNSGIEIFVQPPGKIITHLESLSGGEKAFISIALYFAIIKVNPVPFCVLDEIEAALDEVNVTRFASYLKKFNKDTQFIVVSHRRGTMEEADIIYGITMQEEGVSKFLELNINEYQKNFLEEIS